MEYPHIYMYCKFIIQYMHTCQDYHTSKQSLSHESQIIYSLD